MGAGHSAEGREVSTEDLSRELSLKFAEKCYTQLEIYCFKEVFRTLAEEQSGVRFWSETTLCQFLELPEALGCGSIVNQLATNLGAFPFLDQAPCILTVEALLRVVTILTERYQKVLKRGNKDRLRLLFKALAVYDRRASEAAGDASFDKQHAYPEEEAVMESYQGFAIDQPANDELEEDDDDDLAMAALDSLDAIEAIGLGERRNIRQSFIPCDNFVYLVQLLLVIAPLGPQEKLGSYWELLSDKLALDALQDISNAIGASFSVQQEQGIAYKAFRIVSNNSLPHLFDALGPLFERFLFQKDFDLSKRRQSSVEGPADPASPAHSAPRKDQIPQPPPLLRDTGEILTRFRLTQLSFFIPPSDLFYRLHPLFSGSKHGFSMGSFEQQVFTWRAPTLLLVSGIVLPEKPYDSRERTFADSLPPRRFPNSAADGQLVLYGAYIPVPWKQTHRACFGDESTILFQLHPTHDVFRASSLSKNYASFVTPSHSDVHPGINFGTPLPAKATHTADAVPLGPVSLFLNDALEFGVFTHHAAGGGSFHPSVSPGRQRSTKGDWQDRFEVQALEVRGLGGEKEAERQKRDLAFEEREARLRREAVLGNEQDKAILEMAGLIGHGQSGGSMA